MKNVVTTAPAPVVETVTLADLAAANLATQNALQMLAAALQPRARKARAPSEPVVLSEADRAVKAANMSVGDRQRIFRALLARGNGEHLASDIAADVGLPMYRVRGDLQTVCNRVNDVELFPNIGYSMYLIGKEKGGILRVVFAKNAE
jgi:hypothetical protein